MPHSPISPFPFQTPVGVVQDNDGKYYVQWPPALLQWFNNAFLGIVTADSIADADVFSTDTANEIESEVFNLIEGAAEAQPRIGAELKGLRARIDDLESQSRSSRNWLAEIEDLRTCLAMIDETHREAAGSTASGYQLFIAAAGQTTFTPTVVPTSRAEVRLNRIPQIPGASYDYVVSGVHIVFNFGLSVGDLVEVLQ